MLKLLFTESNPHYMGVDAVRHYLMGIQETKHCYGVMHYINIVWAVVDDAVKTLKLCVPWEDLTTTNQNTSLQFPTTGLHDLARNLALQSELQIMTLPREWREYGKQVMGGYKPQYEPGGGDDGGLPTDRGRGKGCR